MTAMKKMAAALATAGLLASGTVQASLVDRGGGLIYDSDLNITWLANANYGAGSSYDNGFSSTDGRMTWDNAVDWADDLVYGGYSDWRLPTSDTCELYNCTGSELGHLFYTELGGTAGSSILASGDPDLRLFQNIQSNFYWSGTAYAPDPTNFAWSFNTVYGFQYANFQDNEFFAWAVRDDDVAAAVPEPASVMLVGLGLAGLVALRRRRPLGAS